MKFKEIFDDKKPREKAIKYGFESLTDNELLAIILRTGTKEKHVLALAEEIIHRFNGLENLNKVNLNNFLKIKGIGVSKALEILSCLEISKRIKIINSQTKFKKVIWPADAFNLVRNYYENLKNEHFYILLLNNQNRLIHQCLLYKGTHDTINIDIKDIIYLAITYHSTKIICVHNHPSGDSEPSFVDIKTTNEIIKQLKVFEITLLDHIILGSQNYYSINLHKKYYFYN